MKIHIQELKLSTLAVAVAGALASMASMAAYADDQEAAALKTPKSTVEVGASNVNGTSARLGEYNGYNKSGNYFVGGMNIRGGDAYGDNGGTMRWSLVGTDLGLTTRALGGTVSDQGRWNLGVYYDELRHNLSDTYQTPYRGTMGGNTWTLPPGFGIVGNTTTMTNAQKAALQNVDINSTRKNTGLSAGLNLNAQWGIKFDFNRLDQTGAKLMGFGAAGIGGASGEFVSILPSPTNYKTDTVNLALNYMGEKGNASASYYGSYFHNAYDRITFQTFAGANNMQTMSTPPDNNLHQFNLAGGYQLLAKTKLAGNVSYSRNTQDQGYVVDPLMFVAASTAAGNTMTSANALVVTKHADIKVTDQTFKNLGLTAGYKYDLRDNRTASNIYNFHAISGGNDANYPNTPLSIKKSQIELAGDYRVYKDQTLRLAYTRDDISRYCNQYAVGVLYPAGTNCVVATKSKEDKVEGGYRFKALDSLVVRLGYSYGVRKTDFDTNARAAFLSTNGGNGALGFPGQNGGDYQGFHTLLDANRNQQVIKASANWELNDKFSVGLGGRFTDDRYSTTWGMQNGNTWSLNLDGAYRYSDTGTVTAYVTQQHLERTMTDLQRAAFQAATGASGTAVAVPSGATWTDKLKNSDVTVGLGLRHTGLVGGKVDIAGDLSYSMSRSDYNNQLNYATLTTGGLNCAANIILSCGATPDIKITTIQFKLAGTYMIDKKSKVALRYLLQHIDGSDYYYNGYQLGYSPTQVMPTNQQLGNGTIKVISASYIYTF